MSGDVETRGQRSVEVDEIMVTESKMRDSGGI